MWDELVKVALLGAARGELPALPAPIAEALPTSGSAEDRLLSAVAVASRYDVCGRTPAAAAAVPAPAADDPRPPCSSRAADLLLAVVSADARARPQLLAEWLSAAAAADRRVRPALIPTLLDHAVDQPKLRPALLAVVGPRGVWLMGQNPKWQSGLTDTTDPAAAWTTAKPEHRVAALLRVRATDPARGVELVRSTWSEDAADERAAFVDALATGLSAADEPFLESALDDRSKQVRASAVDLLKRLPGSAHVRRMSAAADAQLSFTPAAGSRLLRRGKPAAVVVTLPTGFDTEWAHDGVDIKPSAGLGEKQTWLRQIVESVPPAHWSTAWAATPAECIAALPPEFADVVLAAWDAAAARHPDPAWVAALLSPAARHGRRPPRLELLDALPPDEQQPAAVAVLRSPLAADAGGLLSLLNRTRFPFGPTAAEGLIARIDQHVRGAAAGRYDYTVNQLLESVALRVPPTLHDHLAERWAAPEWEPYRRAVDPCLATLKLRHDIQREFAP